MKKLILKILVLFFILVVIDYSVGLLGRYLLNHALSGQTEKIKYICDRSTEDILIFGSSRAVHHYDPSIIQDSLGMTCYNCGYDGCGSVTALGLIEILSERYTPKIILYEITPEFDYLKIDKDNTKYLGPLKLFYDREGVDSIFIKVNISEKYKMLSQMYRLNSKLIQMFSENVTRRNLSVKGYLPVDRKMNNLKNDISKSKVHLEYDDLKIECLHRIASICRDKGINLIFMVSPYYNKKEFQEFDYAKRISYMFEIPMIIHYDDIKFRDNKDYFYDPIHLNMEGATVLTKIIAPEIKLLMNIETEI